MNDRYINLVILKKLIKLEKFKLIISFYFSELVTAFRNIVEWWIGKWKLSIIQLLEQCPITFEGKGIQKTLENDWDI